MKRTLLFLVVSLVIGLLTWVLLFPGVTWRGAGVFAGISLATWIVLEGLARIVRFRPRS